MAQTLTRINLQLLVLVGVLTVLYWWPAADTRQLDRLSTLTAEQIQTLTIQTLDEEPIQLTRRGVSWWLTQPRELPANEQKVAALLALASTPVYTRLPGRSAAQTEQFITAENHQWLMFNQLRLRFGQRHPLGQRRYLLLRENAGDPGDSGNPGPGPGDELLLVDDLYYHHLRSRWTDWVSRQPLPAGITLTRLKLAGVTLTADPQGWYAAPPQISAEQITQLVGQWQNLVATKVSALPENIHLNIDPDKGQTMNHADLQAVELGWLDASGNPGKLKLYLQQLNSEVQLLDPSRQVVWHLNKAIAAKLVLPSAQERPR